MSIIAGMYIVCSVSIFKRKVHSLLNNIGIFAGVIGCRSGSGLLCFVTLYLLIALFLFSKMLFEVKLYTNSSVLGFVLGDIQKNGFSFVLFWTLTYALIYIY